MAKPKILTGNRCLTATSARKQFAKELAPDVTIVVYNDHGLEVFLDRVPTFGIGAGGCLSLWR